MPKDLYTKPFLDFIKDHKINIRQAAKWLGINYMSLHQNLWHHRKITRPKYITLVYEYKSFLEKNIEKLNDEIELSDDYFDAKKQFKKFIKNYNVTIKLVSDLIDYSYTSLRSNNTKLKPFIMNKVVKRLSNYYTEELNKVNKKISKINI
jgi:hypothetical protein